MEGQLKSEPLKFVSSRMTHVRYAGSGQSIAFSGQYRNAELAVPPLFWPVNCIKIGGHVALLSCRSIYFLFYDKALSCIILKNKHRAKY